MREIARVKSVERNVNFSSIFPLPTDRSISFSYSTQSEYFLHEEIKIFSNGTFVCVVTITR